jgi:hypothetical protein
MWRCWSAHELLITSGVYCRMLSNSELQGVRWLRWYSRHFVLNTRDQVAARLRTQKESKQTCRGKDMVLGKQTTE